MVNSADEQANDGRIHHLTLDDSIVLSVHRVRAGHNDAEEIDQLQQEGWVRPARDGGWLLG
jgi:hypothetical protein